MDLPNVVYDAQILDSQILSPGVKKIVFKLARSFYFEPGQYVWIEIKKLQALDHKGSRRAFSIINLPNDNNIIEILVRFSESGYKQTLFSMKKGDSVVVHGPFGLAFTLDIHDLPPNIVMIPGGVGIAPFLSVLQRIRDLKFPIKCFMVALGSEEDGLFINKLISEYKIKTVLSYFNFRNRKFGPEDVADFLTKTTGSTKWWISGSQGAVDHIHTILDALGISKVDMVFENYYPHNPRSITKDTIESQLVTGNLFSKALQNSSSHTVITDTNGIILFANKAAEIVTGYSLGEMIGNTPRLWGGLMEKEFYQKLWKQKLDGDTFEGEIMNRRKNGEIYFAIAHISPILNENNDVIGFIGTEEDITLMKKQSETLRDSQLRLSFALEGNRDGLWDWDIVSGKVDFSPRFREMLGYSFDDLPGNVDEWKKRVHPDDWPTVEIEVNKLLSGTIRFYETRHRILCKNGSYKWILDRGMVVQRDNKTGKALRAVGTHTDITEIKSHEIELERLNKVMVGRELKLIELKEKIKELLKVQINHDS